MKYFWLLIFIFFQGYLQAFSNHGSDFPAHSSGSLMFDVDVCQLDGPGDSTIIEIIYSVLLSNKNSIQSEQKNLTTLSIDLQIKNASGRILNSVNERRSVSLYDSLNPSNYTTFIDIKRFNILADTVFFDLKIQESQTGTMGQLLQSFKIRRFENSFSISDLYFVSHVQRAAGSSVFDKSGLMLVPNPSRLYFVSGEKPKIYVYYEVNNLTYEVNNPSVYETNPVVQDMAGNEIFSNPKRMLKVTAENTSRIEVIPFAEFSSGIYRLIIEVTDVTSGSREQVAGYFQVDRGDTKETDILPMSEEEEKKYLDQIKYIATDLEKDIFSKLNPTGKQEFILRFWKSKDTNPATPENEFMIEHFRRLAIVEQEFKGGINSDMGRVYITYGAPIDIERKNSMLSSAQSIEIWAYAVEGRTDFVFIDRDGDGKFVLVHSTHRNEYSNPGWQDSLK